MDGAADGPRLASMDADDWHEIELSPMASL
jgi:hypothetical protein